MKHIEKSTSTIPELLNEYSTVISDYVADCKAALKTVNKEQAALITIDEHVDHVEEAVEIAQAVAEEIQKQAHDQIANVVTRCLSTVFETDYGFTIEFEKIRNNTEAKVILTKGGQEIVDPLNSDSGGVIDVAAFALRVACLVMHKPKLRQLLILDEPFKFVSEEYRENVRVMLDELAEDFEIQIIMVTHITELVTGKEIRI